MVPASFPFDSTESSKGQERPASGIVVLHRARALAQAAKQKARYQSLYYSIISTSATAVRMSLFSSLSAC